MGMLWWSLETGPADGQNCDEATGMLQRGKTGVATDGWTPCPVLSPLLLGTPEPNNQI